MHIPNILTIPLQTLNTKIQFKLRTPTSDELQKYMHIELTSIMHWNPHDIKLGKQIQSIHTNDTPICHTSIYNSILHELSPLFKNLKESLICQIQTLRQISSASPHVQARQSYISHNRHKKITDDRLAEKFCISPKRAQMTLNVTTQQGFCSAILPLSRRCHANCRF